MKRYLSLVGASLWLTAVAACLVVLYQYQGAPGQAGQAPVAWPRKSALELDSQRDTLLLFVHPKCPCTVASLEELRRLLARLPAPPRVYVLFTLPSGVEAGWEDGLLKRIATGSTGLETRLDQEALESHRFGIHTSGEVVVYDSRGRLRFCGGITPSRGHQGESIGKTALYLYLRGEGQAQTPRPPCYGCPLEGPSEFCSSTEP
ncbi:MAG: RedB protein [Vulcanimicrobiota bacterium]